MLEKITWGTYIFFAAFCLLALAFTYFFVPETRGKVSQCSLGEDTRADLLCRLLKIWTLYSVIPLLMRRRRG